MIEKDKGTDVLKGSELDAQKKSVADATTIVNLNPSPDSEDEVLVGSLQKDAEGIKKLLAEKRSANAEAKSYRLKLKEIEDAEAKKQEDVLKEQGKLQELLNLKDKELADERELTELNAIQSALEKEALKEGIIDIDGVGLANTDDVIYDSKKRTVEGAKEVIANLKKNKQYLFKTEVSPPKLTPKPKPKVDNSTPSPIPLTFPAKTGHKNIVDLLEKDDAKRG